MDGLRIHLSQRWRCPLIC